MWGIKSNGFEWLLSTSEIGTLSPNSVRSNTQKVSKILLLSEKTNASPAVLFTPLRLLAPLARNTNCMRFPVPEEDSCNFVFKISKYFHTRQIQYSNSPGRWLSTKVGLSPCRPDAGYCLPPSLLLHLLLLLQVPGRHRVSAHHGHPPGLQLGRPGHLH